ncbi:MAG TPA: LysM peptidoglycan-binding domain-containing protein [Thermoanaerobaculia bacterium]|nr:LysM peptidoglycan-binding domain-containing protein [Thermoanaerobaculia bacterium]
MADSKRRFSDHRTTALLDPPEETDPRSPEDFDSTDRMYIVGEDDSLSSIARKFYGNARCRGRILEANRTLIRDPFQIQPGWRLRIPS